MPRSAPAICTHFKARHIGGPFSFLEQHMQSHDYVPNVSGWKLDKVTGEFEINSARISVGGLPEQPQMITVTAGEWDARDLPENAWAYYAFIGSEITKIPGEFRSSAEVSTFDDSYEPGFADIRVRMTYKRPETAEELSARMKKSRSAGYSIKKEGDKLTFLNDGVPRMVLDNLEKTDEKAEKPFVTEGDQLFISEALLANGIITENVGSITDPGKPITQLGQKITSQGSAITGKAASQASFRLTTNVSGNRLYVATGFGIGGIYQGGQTGTPGEKGEKAQVKIDLTVDASKVLYQISSIISTTGLAQSIESLTAKIEHEVTARASADNQLSARIGSVDAALSSLKLDSGIADQIREVLRSELRQGGLLWRSR